MKTSRMSVYTKERVEFTRSKRPRLIVDNPYIFFLCLYDVPLKLVAKAVGVGDDRVKKALTTLTDEPRAPWPCKDVYNETHHSVNKRMVVAAREGEIYRLRRWIEENQGGDLLNAKELLRVLERVETYARNYGVVKKGRVVRPEKRDYEALAAIAVGERWGEQPREPWPVAEPQFHEQFDLDALFSEGGDELGLGA